MSVPTRSTWFARVRPTPAPLSSSKQAAADHQQPGRACKQHCRQRFAPAPMTAPALARATPARNPAAWTQRLRIFHALLARSKISAPIVFVGPIHAGTDAPALGNGRRSASVLAPNLDSTSIPPQPERLLGGSARAPTFQRRVKFSRPDRFCEIVIHTRSQAFFPLSL